jgi:hypothetical protein
MTSNIQAVYKGFYRAIKTLGRVWRVGSDLSERNLEERSDLPDAVSMYPIFFIFIFGNISICFPQFNYCATSLPM